MALLTFLILAVELFVLSSIAGTATEDGRSKEIGQMSGLLPRENLTTSSVIPFNLDKETARLPLYKSKANSQTGAGSDESQGFAYLISDGHGCEDASARNTALVDALRNGGGLPNVFGDSPTLEDPRHIHVYSPLRKPRGPDRQP